VFAAAAIAAAAAPSAAAARRWCVQCHVLQEGRVVFAFLNAWRGALAARSGPLISALFRADDEGGFAFRSPVVYAPYTTLEPVLAILDSVLVLLPDFRYHAVCVGRRGDAPHLVLEFAGTLRARDGRAMTVTGADFLTIDRRTGKITDFFVCLRPLGALTELGQLMKARIEAMLAAPQRSKL
jgi:hypothetical protein